MGKTYTASDLHGNYELWQAMRNLLNDDDRLFMLGDAGDRGLDGYRIICECLDDCRVTYLKGNHDDMFVKAFLRNDLHIRDHWLSYCGGIPTAAAWVNDRAERWVLESLDSAPTYLEYENTYGDRVILTHAGYTPPVIPSECDLVWDRNHIGDGWGDNPASLYVVHGHTPTDQMRYGVYSPLGEACFYCGGHKINIDAGTYHSKKAILLDLDDFTEIRLDASSGEVSVTTTTHEQPNITTDKSVDNFVATDPDGYWYVRDHWEDRGRDMRRFFHRMVSDNVPLRIVEDPSDVVGLHVIGNMVNSEANLSGDISVTSVVQSASLNEATGDIIAHTSTGSVYRLRNPL